ncbi:terminase small subunit [Pseudomonas sp. FP2294]|uniref:terminase small subunit n=1 Tax=Pseudomonas sp. FP2294 TaxID=2954089 RepID=UPI0027334ED5|nr:terminase small subunit [Pseudomonas sp. FP2294]WLH55595.1 terminase small subunit [Pseudomonas sp. FP2294]
MTKLNDRQSRFVIEYLVDLNATQAAIRSGYSKKTAGQIGDENLKKPQIAQAIKEAMDSRNQRVQINADYVLNRLVEIDQLDVLDILDNAGNFKPIMEWPKTWRQTLSGVDLQEIMLGDVETVIRKIKWPDKLRNLELLGKHVAVSAFREQVEVNVTHTLSERMAKARERASNG